LDSDSTSIQTYFLNPLFEFTQTTYPGNLYPIGLPESPPDNLPECLIRALSDHINVYPALYGHTQPNHISQFCSESDFYLPGLTRSYPTKLPYLILSRSDFFLLDHTRPPYPTSLPGRVTLRCIFYQAFLHRVTFCGVATSPEVTVFAEKM
jgi:hypothetical protein